MMATSKSEGYGGKESMKELNKAQCDALWQGSRGEGVPDTPETRRAFFEGLRVGAITLATGAALQRDPARFLKITLQTIEQELA